MGDRKYPSILEIALKAGKWSVIAGSSAAIIGSAGCEEEIPAGVPAMDAEYLDAIDNPDEYSGIDTGITVDVPVVPDESVQDYGYAELMGIAPYDVETGQPADTIDPDVVMTDVVQGDASYPDIGLMGDYADDVVFPDTDVVDPSDVPVTEDLPPVDVVDDDAFLSGGIPMEDL